MCAKEKLNQTKYRNMDKSNILNQFTKRFSTIIFDLDNTLIATRKADLKTCNKVKSFILIGACVYLYLKRMVFVLNEKCTYSTLV